MNIKLPENSLHAILQQLDVVLGEMRTLRQLVQAMLKEDPEEDLVAVLAGSLEPATRNEAETYNTFDVTWQRFTDEQTAESR